MVVPAVGEVVLVPFPFSDLSQTKLRPAICLANVGRGDWILCQITSNQFGDQKAVKLLHSDFATGLLRTDSYARPGKLFTAHSSLLVRSIGRLTQPAQQRIAQAIVGLLQGAISP